MHFSNIWYCFSVAKNVVTRGRYQLLTKAHRFQQILRNLLYFIKDELRHIQRRVELDWKVSQVRMQRLNI